MEDCQIPRYCQSRSRRQQLIPEPQPISCGSISQGIPLRRTNTIPVMPVKHALSAKRGLPPLGFALATKINGSTSFRSASGKNSTVIGQLLARRDVPSRSAGCWKAEVLLDVLSLLRSHYLFTSINL